MPPTSDDHWVQLSPRFSDGDKSFALFISNAKRLRKALSTDDPEQVAGEIESAQTVVRRESKSWARVDRTRLLAALGLLADLARQGWKIRLSRGHVEVLSPRTLREDPSAEKNRVRLQELVKRDEQLKTPSVVKFVRSMEKSRAHGSGFFSIFSLMRDGRDLATSLRDSRRVPLSERADALRRVVDPYVEFVVGDSCCAQTGLRLQDIWRYFRHTWTNQYTSTPGRTMMFLVRDRAVDPHSVIGIGALASPVVQIKERDRWIGWHTETFVNQIRENPTKRVGEWLKNTLETAVSEIFVDDLLQEQIVNVAEIQNPTNEVLSRLTEFGAGERKLHQRFARVQQHKKAISDSDSEDGVDRWVARSQTHLFRSKRALALASLLRARIVVNEHLGSHPSSDAVASMLTDREGKRAVEIILRKARADRVGIAMADISVCGAVAPYNAILGGKLVAMLACSPEVVEEYRRRYGHAESEIASAMAGRSIIRPAELAYIGTTSLYGTGSSQYNRLAMPASRLGGRADEKIGFIELGRSMAYGTSHFSEETVRSLVDLVQQSKGGQRVHSIFGEGVSPKFRKVRDGLDELGLPSSELLKHGRTRIVYGVGLVRNVGDYLLGLDSSPDYLFSTSGEEATSAVGGWWRERWLSRRIESEDVLGEVARQSLVRPIKHDARVVLPRVDDEQISMFDDL